jgi:hypothetical protein
MSVAASLWQMTAPGPKDTALADSASKPGSSTCSVITMIASEAILRLSVFGIGGTLQ